MNRFRTSITLLALLASLTAAAAASAPWLPHARDIYTTALARGQKDGKPVVLFVFDDDDPPFLETARSFDDPAVAKLYGDFVFAKIDSESSTVCRLFHEACDNAPWVYVLDPRAKAPETEPLAKVVGVHKKGGGIPAAKLAEALSAGLAKFHGR